MLQVSVPGKVTGVCGRAVGVTPFVGAGVSVSNVLVGVGGDCFDRQPGSIPAAREARLSFRNAPRDRVSFIAQS